MRLAYQDRNWAHKTLNVLHGPAPRPWTQALLCKDLIWSHWPKNLPWRRTCQAMSVYSPGNGEKPWQHWGCFENDGKLACRNLWLFKHEGKASIYLVLNQAQFANRRLHKALYCCLKNHSQTPWGWGLGICQNKLLFIHVWVLQEQERFFRVKKLSLKSTWGT